MSWVLIEHQALTSSVASVTLGSGGTIPQTYKTLKLVMSARTDLAAITDNIYLQFNGDTGANYTFRRLEGNGATASSSTAASNAKYFLAGYATGSSATSSTFGSVTVDLPNYTGSTQKPASTDGVSENNATTATQGLQATIWTGTSAITSIVAKSYDNANFVSGSTFTLYGLSG